jgi:hypothetical protein
MQYASTEASTMTPEQEQGILSALDRELAADRRDPLIRLVREMFDSYGQRATGHDHALVHAVVACLKPQPKALTVTEIRDALEQEFCDSGVKRNWQDDLRVARAIEALILEKYS